MISKKLVSISFAYLIISYILATSAVMVDKVIPSTDNITKIEPLSTQTEISTLWNNSYTRQCDIAISSIIRCSAGGYILTGWTNRSQAIDYDIWVVRIDDNGNHIWNYTYGGIGEDKGFQIIESNGGGFAIVSTFYNTSATHNNTDLYVIRLTNSGIVIWNRTFSGPFQNSTHSVSDIGRSIVECPNGDFVIAGATINTNVSANNGDIWLIRLNPGGNRIWERLYHNRITDRCYTPHSLVKCADGGFAIAGYSINSSHSNDVWLIRTNQNGFHLWNQSYGGSLYERPEALIECSNGGFGIIANTESFGGGGKDAWVVRTDLGGNKLWNQTFGGIEEDWGSQIIELPDRSFTFVGSTHSYDIGNGDLWLVRLDANGNLIWNHTVGDPYGNSGASFVYEGNSTYTCAGTTNPVGETYSDLWVLKVQVATIKTNNNNVPIASLFIWIIISIIILIGFTSIITIWWYIKKRSINSN
jgi:hypothetical protein